MIKVVDVVYHCHKEYDQPQQVIAKHAPSLGFTDYIKDRLDISFVKHSNYEGFQKIDNVPFAFFKSRNRFFYIPFKTHRYIKNLDPDIVIVEGLIFPLQLMMLKLFLARKCIIVVQHHGESPYKGYKKILQQLSGKFISLFLFTSCENAIPWIKAGVIMNSLQCRELQEASTYFCRAGRKESQERCGISGDHNFLWVGRFNENKDPVTVLKGFEHYAAKSNNARLYMISQEGDLFNEVKKMINKSTILNRTVKLLGKIPHEELRYWYSSCNFFLSGSLKEGSGYALMEAMSCGCIPIVTAIPSFKKLTCNGKYGFLYPPGNEKDLSEILVGIEGINIEEKANEVERYFQKNLAFKNIADDMVNIFEKLIPVK